MNRKLIILTVLILVVLASGLVFAADTPVDEVAALRAELASTKAELNKIKYANVPSIEQQINPTPDDWKDVYGDTKNTQLYFNHKAAWVQIELCKKAIRLLASTITDITNPDDPNSLVSRMSVLEEKVADMPVFETHNGIPISITLPCEAVGAVDSNKTLKPDDPEEMAK